MSFESVFHEVRFDALRAEGSPDLVVAVAREVFERGLEGVPRFSRAIEGRSLGELVETLVQGMLTLLRNEAAGFSVCPLVTETVRFTAQEGGRVELSIHFCAALLTFATAVECTAKHQDLGTLGHTYYDDVFLPFVRRRLEDGIERVRTSDVEEARSEVVRLLTVVLTDLRSEFPLGVFQRRYEEAQERAEVRDGFVFALCAQMREEARRRLGI